MALSVRTRYAALFTAARDVADDPVARRRPRAGEKRTKCLKGDFCSCWCGARAVADDPLARAPVRAGGWAPRARGMSESERALGRWGRSGPVAFLMPDAPYPEPARTVGGSGRAVTGGRGCGGPRSAKAVAQRGPKGFRFRARWFGARLRRAPPRWVRGRRPPRLKN